MLGMPAMRSLSSSALFAALFIASSLVTACSSGPDDSAFHKSSRAGETKAPTGVAAPSPAAPTAASTPQSPAATTTPAAKPASPPATPLRTNVCENPTCSVKNGACGCTAQDTSGQTVEMDCQGGVCTCFTGDQGTTQVDDDNCASDGEARTLFSANCGCL